MGQCRIRHALRPSARCFFGCIVCPHVLPLAILGHASVEDLRPPERQGDNDRHRAPRGTAGHGLPLRAVSYSGPRTVDRCAAPLARRADIHALERVVVLSRLTPGKFCFQVGKRLVLQPGLHGVGKRRRLCRVAHETRVAEGTPRHQSAAYTLWHCRRIW